MTSRQLSQLLRRSEQALAARQALRQARETPAPLSRKARLRDASLKARVLRLTDADAASDDDDAAVEAGEDGPGGHTLHCNILIIDSARLASLPPKLASMRALRGAARRSARHDDAPTTVYVVDRGDAPVWALEGSGDDGLHEHHVERVRSGASAEDAVLRLANVLLRVLEQRRVASLLLLSDEPALEQTVRLAARELDVIRWFVPDNGRVRNEADALPADILLRVDDLLVAPVAPVATPRAHDADVSRTDAPRMASSGVWDVSFDGPPRLGGAGGGEEVRASRQAHDPRYVTPRRRHYAAESEDVDESSTMDGQDANVRSVHALWTPAQGSPKTPRSSHSNGPEVIGRMREANAAALTALRRIQSRGATSPPTTAKAAPKRPEPAKTSEPLPRAYDLRSGELQASPVRRRAESAPDVKAVAKASVPARHISPKPSPKASPKATMTVSSPKVSSPKVSSPEVSSPEVSSPKAANPKAASPKTASPKTASRTTAGNTAASPSAKARIDVSSRLAELRRQLQEEEAQRRVLRSVLHEKEDQAAKKTAIPTEPKRKPKVQYTAGPPPQRPPQSGVVREAEREERPAPAQKETARPQQEAVHASNGRPPAQHHPLGYAPAPTHPPEYVPRRRYSEDEERRRAEYEQQRWPSGTPAPHDAHRGDGFAWGKGRWSKQREPEPYRETPQSYREAPQQHPYHETPPVYRETPHQHPYHHHDAPPAYRETPQPFHDPRQHLYGPPPHPFHFGHYGR